MKKLIKTDFDKTYEELSKLNEGLDIESLPVIYFNAFLECPDIKEETKNLIRRRFTLANNMLFISFQDIISFDPGKDREAYLQFWLIIKLIINSKYKTKEANDVWYSRLVNNFYKPAKTEYGILDTLKELLPDCRFRFAG